MRMDIFIEIVSTAVGHVIVPIFSNHPPAKNEESSRETGDCFLVVRSFFFVSNSAPMGSHKKVKTATSHPSSSVSNPRNSTYSDLSQEQNTW
jgi:hypothetical protein